MRRRRVMSVLSASASTVPPEIAVEADGVPCVADGTEFVCSVTPGPGARTVLIQAPGFVSSTESVITAAPPAGCCTCSPQTMRAIRLRSNGSDAGAHDAGAADTGTSDTGASDAGVALDVGREDANASDAGGCDESRVHFLPAGGHLVVDQLCDDVFACAVDAADAARIIAAAPGFTCSSIPEGPCAATTCVLRPSTLDAGELSAICALTALASPPALTCMIYL